MKSHEMDQAVERIGRRHAQLLEELRRDPALDYTSDRFCDVRRRARSLGWDIISLETRAHWQLRIEFPPRADSVFYEMRARNNQTCQAKLVYPYLLDEQPAHTVLTNLRGFASLDDLERHVSEREAASASGPQ